MLSAACGTCRIALETRLADLTAPLEPDVGGKVTKFEVLGRLEREMRAFFTEEEVQNLVDLAKPTAK